MKNRPVVKRLKYELLVDALDHCTGLLAGRVEAEIHQDDKTVERGEQAAVFIRPAPVTGARLASEKVGSPTFGCDPRSLSCKGAGGFVREVPHDLPADRGIGIEEPFEQSGARCVILEAHLSLIANGRDFGCPMGGPAEKGKSFRE